MAVSVGLMNLVCSPFGGIPMCHGSGGLAAQYRFGARTGGSVVILGLAKIAVGFAFGGALLGLLGAYPYGILGPMLVFAGIELARYGQQAIVGQRDQGLVVDVDAAIAVQIAVVG